MSRWPQRNKMVTQGRSPDSYFNNGKFIHTLTGWLRQLFFLIPRARPLPWAMMYIRSQARVPFQYLIPRVFRFNAYPLTSTSGRPRRHA